MWPLLWIVLSTSWEWTSCNFMLPPTQEKQCLISLLPGRQEVPMEYSLRFLWPVTLCHPWITHLYWHKHSSTWWSCQGSKDIWLYSFARRMCSPCLLGESSSVLKGKVPLFSYNCFLGSCPIRSQDLPRTPRPLPWKLDSCRCRFHHSGHERHKEIPGSQWL